MFMIKNTHTRTLPAPASQVGALIDGLGSEDDQVWPGNGWAAIRFDGPLAVGASGGHGSIRYDVTEYEPGVGITFTFGPGVGLSGTHRFEVVAESRERSVLRHTIDAKPYGWMRLGWPLAVRWGHDALLEEALDNAERAVTGTVERPYRRSPLVRSMLAIERRLDSRTSSRK